MVKRPHYVTGHAIQPTGHACWCTGPRTTVDILAAHGSLTLPGKKTKWPSITVEVEGLYDKGAFFPQKSLCCWSCTEIQMKV